MPLKFPTLTWPTFNLSADDCETWKIVGGSAAAIVFVHAFGYWWKVKHFPKFNNEEEKFITVKAKNPVERKKALLERRKEYWWHYDVPDVPPFLRAIPRHEYSKRTQDHHINFQKRVAKATAALKLSGFVDKLVKPLRDGKKVDPFEKYNAMFSGALVKAPKAAAVWRRDDYFASQRLTGINPMLIEKVTSLEQTKMPIQDAHVRDILPPGYTLQRLIDEDRLYKCDYEMLERVRHTFPIERRMYAPIILFYSTPHENQLMPLAVQLGQQSGVDFPIITPRDPPGIWLLTKMHCQVAEANLHEVAYHLMPTHIMMESIYVSMVRNVSTQHPIHTWLRQHFFYTVNINWAARTLLIGPEGAVPKLMMGYEGTVALLQESSREFHFSQLDIPAHLERRGMMDTQKTLPKYYYRDDALRLWKIVGKFVEQMVNAIFSTDKELADDYEIQNWIEEITHQRGPAGCGLRGIPVDSNGKMTSRMDFIRFLHMIIYNVSCTHAAVNNGQFDQFGFVPNCPFNIKMGAPVTKNYDIPEEEIAAQMLTSKEAVEAVVFVHMLTMSSANVDDEPDKFGVYYGGFFKRAPFAEIIGGFQKELKDCSTAIRSRGEEYRYLDPELIAQGVDA